MVAARADARGVSEAEYLSGNLLGREVIPRKMWREAFRVSGPGQQDHCNATITVDGGNIEASLR